MSSTKQVPKGSTKVYNSAVEMAEDVERQVKEADTKYLELMKKNDKSKKQIIVDYANALEGTMHVSSICAHMAEVLKEFTGPNYIRECLPSEFKDAEQQRRAFKNSVNPAGTVNRARTKKGKNKKKVIICAEQDKGKEDSGELWQINPKDYNMEDLPNYDFAFRGRLIEYLHSERVRLLKEVNKQ